MPVFHLGDMTLTSPAFQHGERIPDRHTCNGADLSPELHWSGVPNGTKELVLICHDPDAPVTHGWTHWVLYGIPADLTGLPEGVTPHGDNSIGTEGTTTFDAQQFNGPAPPPGHGTHHYFFHLYALSEVSNLSPGLTREEVLEAIDRLITVQARLVGTYSR